MCVYLCVGARVYVVYVFVFLCQSVCVFVCIYKCVRIFGLGKSFLSVYVCKCVRLSACLCVYVFACLCV